MIFNFYHTKDEIRVEILFDEKGTRGFLDIAKSRYDLLRTAVMLDNGKVLLESDEVSEAKRPYPAGREWRETRVKKPKRNQQKFRKIVLEAYDSTCAVCDIITPSLLRAAHIVPVEKSNDDTIKNGICLCVNHEIAFDRGIMLINPDGEVFVQQNEEINVKLKKYAFRRNK